MAEPKAYVYLTESAQTFAQSELGRRVVEGPSSENGGGGRIAARSHTLSDSGWIRFYAIPTDSSDEAEKISVSLPPHAVAGVASIPKS
jgi:hypothetical protein